MLHTLRPPALVVAETPVASFTATIASAMVELVVPEPKESEVTPLRPRTSIVMVVDRAENGNDVPAWCAADKTLT